MDQAEPDPLRSMGGMDPLAERAWFNGLFAGEHHGATVSQRFCAALLSLSYGAADYVHEAKRARAGRPHWTAEELELHRQEVRALMELCSIVHADWAGTGPRRADGLDSQIAALCEV